MFLWIKILIRELRINLDFYRYEQQQHVAHAKEAKIRFPTDELKAEKSKIIKSIELEADTKFGTLSTTIESSKKKLEQEANEIELLLRFFTRNYAEELINLATRKEIFIAKKKSLYKELDEVKESLSEAYDEKNYGHSQHRRHKNEINSWYEKSQRSPWLLGNAGMKLPKHSLLGQSFGDLNSYKYHRNSAYNKIKQTKNEIRSLKDDRRSLNLEINHVKSQIEEVSSKITQVNNDLDFLFELIKSGHQQGDLETKLQDLKTTIDTLDNQLRSIPAEKFDFITQEKHLLGVNDLEAKIIRIIDEKNRFHMRFNSDISKKHRRRTHKELWLKNRGLA